MSDFLYNDYLPLSYNESKLVLIPRDPKCIFAYWEIAEQEKKEFINNFGKDAWDKSTPALKVFNVSKNLYFFIDINDFAKSWYINVDDSDSIYTAEIGRRINNNFVNFTHSNSIKTPVNSVSKNIETFFVNCMDLENKTYSSEISSYNLSCLRLLNLSSSELVGRKCELITPPSSAAFYGIETWKE